MAATFKYAEFERLLSDLAINQSLDHHCSPTTIEMLRCILTTDYEYRADDIEYLMDITNMNMRLSGYRGVKRRYPISNCLDKVCQEPLWITRLLPSLDTNNEAVGL